MNTQYMKVNPNELVIDLPVDNSKVSELMESIRTYGLLQAPHIWLKGLRVIDGFHRVVACQRICLSEIDCIVTDCDEDAFWDARIIAAKPHSAISDDRLSAWICESWKLSGWYERPDLESIKKDYALFGVQANDNPSEDELVKFSAAKKVIESVGVDFSGKHHPTEIGLWFKEKASRWGITEYNTRVRLLRALGYPEYSDLVYSELVSLDGLSFPARRAVIIQTERVLSRGRRGDKMFAVREWVETVKSTGQPQSFNDFWSQKQKENEERQQKESEDRRLEQLRISQWEQSPAGQEEIRKKRVAYLDGQIEHIFNRIDALDTYGFPESLRRLTSLIAVIENKIDEEFPDHKKKTRANPLIVENIELRKQVEEQQRKIKSLEMALKAKASVAPNLSGVIALSESELV